MSLLQQVGYTENSDEAKNFEYTFLEGLHEMVTDSAC